MRTSVFGKIFTRLLCAVGENSVFLIHSKNRYFSWPQWAQMPIYGCSTIRMKLIHPPLTPRNYSPVLACTAVRAMWSQKKSVIWVWQSRAGLVQHPLELLHSASYNLFYRVPGLVQHPLELLVYIPLHIICFTEFLGSWVIGAFSMLKDLLLFVLQCFFFRSRKG